MPISIWLSVVRPMTLSVSRRLDGDARQLGGGADQRIERQVDARRDDAALVGAASGDHVEGRRGAEVDDDQVARIFRVGGDGVERPVGADILRLVDVELRAASRPRPARRPAASAEIFLGQHFEIVERARARPCR